MTIHYTDQSRTMRREPVMGSRASHLPPVIALPAPSTPEPRFDLRNVSPRRFAEIAHELYVEGSLRWEEYLWVGFPSELHPDFDITIGALTGERAQPDRPRDMLAEIEDRVEFMKRYGANQTQGFWRAERALDILRRQVEARAA
jgi:hypothetical protein